MRGFLADLRGQRLRSGQRHALHPGATLRTFEHVYPHEGREPLCGRVYGLLGRRRDEDTQQAMALCQSPAFDAVGQQAVGHDMPDKAVQKVLGSNDVDLLSFSVAALSKP